jgi:hypothetical protein
MVYQAQSDTLNRLYIPVPFTAIQFSIMDGISGVSAATQLIGNPQMTVTAFQLIVDVQFLE